MIVIAPGLSARSNAPTHSKDYGRDTIMIGMLWADLLGA